MICNIMSTIGVGKRGKITYFEDVKHLFQVGKFGELLLFGKQGSGSGLLDPVPDPFYLIKDTRKFQKNIHFLY